MSKFTTVKDKIPQKLSWPGFLASAKDSRTKVVLARKLEKQGLGSTPAGGHCVPALWGGDGPGSRGSILTFCLKQQFGKMVFRLTTVITRWQRSTLSTCIQWRLKSWMKRWGALCPCQERGDQGAQAEGVGSRGEKTAKVKTCRGRGRSRRSRTLFWEMKTLVLKVWQVKVKACRGRKTSSRTQERETASNWKAWRVERGCQEGRGCISNLNNNETWKEFFSAQVCQ